MCNEKSCALAARLKLPIGWFCGSRDPPQLSPAACALRCEDFCGLGDPRQLSPAGEWLTHKTRRAVRTVKLCRRVIAPRCDAKTSVVWGIHTNYPLLQTRRRSSLHREAAAVYRCWRCHVGEGRCPCGTGRFGRWHSRPFPHSGTRGTCTPK